MGIQEYVYKPDWDNGCTLVSTVGNSGDNRWGQCTNLTGARDVLTSCKYHRELKCHMLCVFLVSYALCQQMCIKCSVFSVSTAVHQA